MTTCIVSYGIQSPTGMGAAMSIANVMAGIARKIRFARIEDMRFRPVTLGIAEYLNEDCLNSDRMDQLMGPAFEEALEALSEDLL